MTEEDQSLKDLFEATEHLRRQLDSLQASSEQYQSNLQQALKGYERCQDLTVRLNLFSPNETMDDIATSDLKYLTTDSILADLLSRNFIGDRTQILKKSQIAYTQYLGRLDDYDNLPGEHKSLYERFLENKDDFSVLPPNDPLARRNIKIARYQKEKEIQQKLQHLSSNPRVQQDDDSAVRELRLTDLSLRAHQAFQALDVIGQELKILALAPPLQPEAQTPLNDSRQATTDSQANYSDRLDLGLHSMLQGGKSGPLLSKSGRPLQPFTLLDSRERLRNGVFRPGHSLPTMSIEEYLEEERRRGGIIEGGGEPPVVEPNEDDIDAADRQTIKARE